MFSGNTAWGIHSGSWNTGPGYGECAISIFMTAGGLLWDGVNTRIMLATTVIADGSKRAAAWRRQTSARVDDTAASFGFLATR